MWLTRSILPPPAVPVFFHAFASRGEGSMWVPGRFSLGRWSRPLALVSSMWITVICAIFVLPQVRAAWHLNSTPLRDSLASQCLA